MRRLVLAAGTLACGVVLASLPVGELLLLPTTLLFVLGLLATPMAAYLLRDVHREISARERDAADLHG